MKSFSFILFLAFSLLTLPGLAAEFNFSDFSEETTASFQETEVSLGERRRLPLRAPSRFSPSVPALQREIAVKSFFEPVAPEKAVAYSSSSCGLGFQLVI